MRILVTGGAGFIGSHLVEALLPFHTVAVLDNLSTGRRENLPPCVPFYHIDLCDSESVQAHFQNHTYEVVFHLAAQVDVRTSIESPVQDAQTNILGFLHLLEALKYQRPWIIFTSTGGAIYGEKPILPISEAETPQPESPYGIAKLTGELYLKFFSHVYGIPFTILRLANVFGPRQNPLGEAGVVAIFIYKLLRGHPAFIYGDGEQTRDFIYVEDVVRACTMVLEHPLRAQGEIFNVGTGYQTSVNALYTQIATLLRVQAPPIYHPPKLGEIRLNALSPQKLTEYIGWQPQVSLEEGIQRTIAAFQKALAGENA
ncbi:MAG: NAD-dependent epimerase/dehydratase family protein [Bacteroidia bacterium]|nr:NAD-dependent epimerase/dehydratase family protein [Bacteroidia bacterium]